jgi:hypothetical protein
MTYSKLVCDWTPQKITTRIRTCMLSYPFAYPDTYTVHLSRDDDEKLVYSDAYESITGFIPGLKKFNPVDGDGNHERLYKIVEIVSQRAYSPMIQLISIIQIQKGCNAARSDTFKRINQFTEKYLNSGTSPIRCNAGSAEKSSRGLNHPQIGRLIIPAVFVAEWDEDPELYVVQFLCDHPLISHIQLKGELQFGPKSNHGLRHAHLPLPRIQV